MSLLCVFILLTLIFATCSFAEFGFPEPGLQVPSSTTIMESIFFKREWTLGEEYDYIVVGSGFCSFAFVSKVLEINPFATILVLERGSFFLPEHFQALSATFQGTVAAKLESYPWVLTRSTTTSQYSKWVHGVAPFFGGRSTKWSAWCPRPTEDELTGWPASVIRKMHNHFPQAEKILNVSTQAYTGQLQKQILKIIAANISRVKAATRVQSAPLSLHENSKFSVVPSWLQLILRQKAAHGRGEGAELHVVINCIVTSIDDDNKRLATTKGDLLYNHSTKLVLAAGSIPATTLILNSFPHLRSKVGQRFTTHFISAVAAKIPRESFKFTAGEELGAFYLAGLVDGQQFHIQASLVSSHTGNLASLQQSMPDVLTSASEEQMADAKDSIVFVYAILGEQKVTKKSWIRLRKAYNDTTANAEVQLLLSPVDYKTWDGMEAAAFDTLEKVFSPTGEVSYWSSSAHAWVSDRPTTSELRLPGLVHEASSLYIGDEEDAPVDLNYQLKGVSGKIYVTGGGLWPRSGSWNPTLTMVALSLDLAQQLELKH